MAHRSVPVRKRYVADLFRAKIGRPRGHGARGPQRRRRSRIRADHAAARRDRSRLRRRVAAGQGHRCADRGAGDPQAAPAGRSARPSPAKAPTSEAQVAGRAARRRRSGTLRRPSPGARGLCDGPHSGHSVARRIAALCRAGSRRRRLADHRHRCRRHAGNLRAAADQPCPAGRSPALVGAIGRGSTTRPRCSARAARCERACGASSRSTPWWKAVLPPIAKRWRSENSRNSA